MILLPNMERLGQLQRQPSVNRPARHVARLLEALRTLANVRVCEGRVTHEMLAGELAPMRARTFAGVPTPGVGGRCRVVVSGPASFNGAVKEMLIACGLETERITILSA